jgi:hypothetical protein
MILKVINEILIAKDKQTNCKKGWLNFNKCKIKDYSA